MRGAALHPYFLRARSFSYENRRYWPLAALVAFILMIYIVSKATDGTQKWMVYERSPNFSDSRILSSTADSVVTGKENLFDRKTLEMTHTQQELLQKVDALNGRLSLLERKPTSGAQTEPGTNPATEVTPKPGETENQESKNNNFQSNPPTSTQSSSRILGTPPIRKSGPDLITFPVKTMKTNKELTVSIPSGSYVRGKLLTGIEAPEGKTYPVLLQLDYALILPNQQRLDLTGCFMIVKATGNLSIERVEMQATKLSCVAQSGEMFEREINGFVADDKDNSFALVGSVNTKQQRVATVAFLASIVDGVGRAIQQAQSTQQTTALGGSQSVITGDQMKFIGAGGAATAANMVAQWYLKQAQNLLPTINVGSGRDVWVVMQDSVHLPNSYFQKVSKGEENENPYSYFTRVLR